MAKKEAVKTQEISQRIAFLRKIPFFTSFDDHELKQLMAVSRWLKVPAGKLVIKENTTDRILYILVKGSVSVFKTISGQENMELSILHAGDTFGEMALVSETKRTAGVRTLEEAYILMVEPEILHHANVFLQLKFYKRCSEILVQRLVAANRKLAGITDEPDESLEPAPKQAPKKPAVAAKPPVKPPVAKPAVTELELPPMPEEKKVARARMQRRVLAGRDLPANQAVAAQLTAFLASEDDDTRKFAELIGQDPAMAAKALQVANSSFYRRSTAVSSVAHALVTVGIKNIQEVLEEEMLHQGGEDELFGGFSDLARSYWQHSVVVGRIAELLKEVIRIDTYEDVYLAGLLHDIGKLVLDEQEPAFYPQLQRPTFLEQDICELEHRYIGGDHATAGGWLAEKLGLSQSFIEAIRLHHIPQKAKENPALVALITLADLFAIDRGVCMGHPPTGHSKETIIRSFAWILIQEHQKTFLDVNVADFVEEFDQELDRSWSNIIGDIPL